MFRSTTRCLALLLMSLAAAAGEAQALPKYATPQQITLPAGSLTGALNKLINQAGIQIMYEPSLTRGVQVPAVSGMLTFEQALTQLLANTGLKADEVDEKTVVLRRAKPSASAGVPADQMRLAADMANGRAAGRSSADEAQDQMTVQGRREGAAFKNGSLDLTRTEEDVLPFTVFTARDIELSGVSSVNDFLKQRLAQNFTSDELDGAGALTLDGPQNLNDPIDFRGWGSTETVVLLNGRRMGAEYQDMYGDGTTSTASLRAIPVASIERIEILTSAGSAIYGNGATGGVINIITRRDYTGGQLSVNYETPADVLRSKRGVSFSFSQPVAGFGLRLGGGYNDEEPLRVGDRVGYTIARYRRLALERDPARLIARTGGDPFRTSTTNVFGTTPNIRSSSTSYSASGANGKPGNLFADLPGAARSNFTSVPEGYTTRDLAAFTGRQGVYNTDLMDAPGSASGLGGWIKPQTRNMQFSIGIDRALGERWTWSLDYNQGESRGRLQPKTDLTFSSTAGSYVPPRVPAAAVTNPFGQDVFVSLIDPNLDRPELAADPRSSTRTLSSTLTGRIGKWQAFVDASLSENRNESVSNYFQEPVGGWRQALMSGAYDPFVDARYAQRAAAGFYDQYVRRSIGMMNTTRNTGAALKASGPLHTLPAGAVQLTAGLEWLRSDRNRSDLFVRYTDSQTGAPETPFGVAPGGYLPVDNLLFQYSDGPGARLFTTDSHAAYAEATVPLISALQAVPLVRSLELFGSARADRIVSKGRATDMYGTPAATGRYENTAALSAYGLRYTVFEGLALRASRSAGVKPPLLDYIAPVAGVEELSFDDPNRDGAPRTVLQPGEYLTGGNPDLRPESTRSTNIGLQLAPKWAPGLRLSVDYLESVRDDAIFSIGVLDAIAFEDEIPGLVQRGAPDGDPSGLGPVTFLDTRYRNLRQIAVRSLDIRLDQRIADVGGGQLALNVAATKNLSFKVQSSNTGAAVEQVRNPAAVLSRQIAWNGNAQLYWEGPRLTLGWSVRYYDDLLVTPALMTLQGGDRAPWQLTHDLNINYRTPSAQAPRGLRELLAGTSLTFGVKNVFDRAPRFWAGSSQGIAAFDRDVLVGRTVWLQLRKDFGG